MKITVKMLQGLECNLDVSPDITVAKLKELVAGPLRVPKNEQKILLLGKPLLDDKLLQDCGVKEGSKLNLIRRILENSQSVDRLSLRDAMLAFLLKHMPANNALKVLDEFMKEFNKSVSSLSIDDVERIAKTRLQEESNAAMFSN